MSVLTFNLETARGARNERAAIVAWLKQIDGPTQLHKITEAIERGDHLRALSSESPSHAD